MTSNSRASPATGVAALHCASRSSGKRFVAATRIANRCDLTAPAVKQRQCQLAQCTRSTADQHALRLGVARAQTRGGHGKPHRRERVVQCCQHPKIGTQRCRHQIGFADDDVGRMGAAASSRSHEAEHRLPPLNSGDFGTEFLDHARHVVPDNQRKASGALECQQPPAVSGRAFGVDGVDRPRLNMNQYLTGPGAGHRSETNRQSGRGRRRQANKLASQLMTVGGGDRCACRRDRGGWSRIPRYDLSGRWLQSWWSRFRLP